MIARKKGALISVRSDHGHRSKVLNYGNTGRVELNIAGLKMANAVLCRPRLQSSMARESNRDKDVTTVHVYPPRGREVSVSDLRSRAPANG
jgi:hypothetical protein